MPRRLSGWSVDETYVNAQGAMCPIDPVVRAAIQEAVAACAGSRRAAAPPIITRPDDQAAVTLPFGRGRLVLEDEAELDVAEHLPAGLPLGYHQLWTDAASEPQRVIVSPGRCHLPDWFPAWAWSVQLYALRSSRSWGVGDLGDLRHFGRLAARQGAAAVLVNPLHATAPTPPVDPSPYSPSSRRFYSPMWLDMEQVPGGEGLVELPGLADTATTLDRDRRINRDPAFRLKLHALKQLWSHFPGDPGFDCFRRERGEVLRRYATFCALAEHHGPQWWTWPEEFRHPGSSAVARQSDEGPNVDVHIWSQWLLEQQLADAAGEVGLIQDLPVGFDRAGADAWEYQDLIVDGYSVGTPPDVFAPDGQDWGLPVFSPPALAAAGYEPFIQTIRASLRHAVGLRIDHVMGLFRQWWVPAGASPREGAYVRFPADDLLDVVALESHRAKAFIVGEDLGTVEDGVRASLAERAMLSYRLLWFEHQPPREWPRCSLGAVSTHDLPTVAGVWTGADLEEQRRLGIPADRAGAERLREQLVRFAAVPPDAPGEAAIDAAHRALADAASDIVAVSLDDALGVTERPNLPAAAGQRPNWSIALPALLDDLESDPRLERVAEIMRGRGRVAR